MKIKRKKFKTETELAESVVLWLKRDGWEVYKEVKLLKQDIVADIVALKNNNVWIIESKLIYGSKVLEQAFRWKNYSDFVSIAVQQTPENIVLDFFLKEKGIGRFWVIPSENGNYVHLNQSPKVNIPHLKNDIILSLREEQKSSIAGSLAGSVVTPYKITINQIKKFLTIKNSASIDEIVDNINHHYSSRNVAVQTLKKRLIDIETDFDSFFDSNKKMHFKLKKTI